MQPYDRLEGDGKTINLNLPGIKYLTAPYYQDVISDRDNNSLTFFTSCFWKDPHGYNHKTR